MPAARVWTSVHRKSPLSLRLMEAGGGGLQNKSGETEKKTRARKMTHTVQSSASLMESINNVTSPTLLLKEPNYQSYTWPFFPPAVF